MHTVFVLFIGGLCLKVTFPKNYPEVIPNIEVPLRFSPISYVTHQSLLLHLNRIVSIIWVRVQVLSSASSMPNFLIIYQAKLSISADTKPKPYNFFF